MIIFPNPGKENTAAAVAAAMVKAAELNCPIVVASNTGASAEAVLEQGWCGRLVVVRNCSTAANQGVNRMTSEVRKKLEGRGCTVIAAANALSGGERSLSTKFQVIDPMEVLSHTQRMFGQGVKVCVECATMAMDADELPFGQPVVALGGTAVGLDTAVVLTPSFSSSVLDTKIHEILCKPY